MQKFLKMPENKNYLPAVRNQAIFICHLLTVWCYLYISTAILLVKACFLLSLLQIRYCLSRHRVSSFCTIKIYLQC